MPRSAQTKLLLAQSLQQLMVTSPLEKISVNDIVDNAQVGRNTFYYHFEDKYDLVNWYFQTGVTRFLMDRSAYTDFETLLTALEEYFRENRTFYMNALQYYGQNSLHDYIFDFLTSLYIQRARDVLQENDPATLNLLGHFLAGASLGVLMPWIHDGMKTHTEWNVELIEKLLHDGPRQVLFHDFKDVGHTPPTDSQNESTT